MGGEGGRPVWRPSANKAMKDNLDEKLAAALHDVPVPEGLADRLLERLKNEESERAKKREKCASSSFSHSFVPGLSLAATAAVLLIAVWLGMRRSEGISESFVLDEAIRSFDMGVDEPGPLLAEKPAPAGYPFSPAVLQLRGTRWRLLEAFLGRRGVVYDLPGPAGTTASLYVVDAEGLDGFGTAPALYPLHDRRVLCLVMAGGWDAVCPCCARRSGDLPSLSERPARPGGVTPVAGDSGRRGQIAQPRATGVRLSTASAGFA